MGWKTVIVGSEAKVSLSLNKLKITIGNEFQNVPLGDIDTVIFSHNRVIITIPLLSALVENNINIIICDEKIYVMRRMTQLVYSNHLMVILLYSNV